MRLDWCNPEVLWGYHASIVHVLEHSIGDLAIHFVTWILGAIGISDHHTPPDKTRFLRVEITHMLDTYGIAIRCRSIFG